jgi:hypothetical protein
MNSACDMHTDDQSNSQAQIHPDTSPNHRPAVLMATATSPSSPTVNKGPHLPKNWAMPMVGGGPFSHAIGTPDPSEHPPPPASSLGVAAAAALP